MFVSFFVFFLCTTRSPTPMCQGLALSYFKVIVNGKKKTKQLIFLFFSSSLPFSFPQARHNWGVSISKNLPKPWTTTTTTHTTVVLLLARLTLTIMTITLSKMYLHSKLAWLGFSPGTRRRPSLAVTLRRTCHQGIFVLRLLTR